jgi:HAD superfamily hydrolase (TIGR01450 family)
VSLGVIAAYDAALFDLDGVVYRGPDAVPGAAEGIKALRDLGIKVGFVTNNAARSPSVVAGHLDDLGIPATADDVVTSAQAIAKLMAADLPRGAAVLVTGTDALLAEVRAVGLTPVKDANDRPVAVVVGFAPELTWDDLNEAAYAVQSGAVWYGCNPDRTRPTDRGLAIGLGTMLDALGEVLPGQRPIMAGKPFRPLLDETVRRLGTQRPIFVGDRLDTDIEGANAVGMDSMLVLSGSHGPEDLLAAEPRRRPTYVAADLRGLLVAPVADHPDLVSIADGRLLPTSVASSVDRLSLLWSAAQAAWRAADAGRPLDVSLVLTAVR